MFALNLISSSNIIEDHAKVHSFINTDLHKNHLFC